VIEAGARGFGAPEVLIALTVAVAALVVFAVGQARGTHPMLPPDLVRSRIMLISSGTGFAFMVGFYGMVFVYSLYLQQQRELSSFQTGLVFLPTTALSGFVSIAAARLTERFGPRVPSWAGCASDYLARVVE
jgi:DHA2 family methylenomycin A resistance protein-like MFS transporter